MDKLQQDYRAVGTPAELQDQLLANYESQLDQPKEYRQWLAPAAAFSVLLLGGLILLFEQPSGSSPNLPTTVEQVSADDARVGVHFGDARLAAITPNTSRLSQLAVSRLGAPTSSELGRLSRLPSVPRSPRT